MREATRQTLSSGRTYEYMIQPTGTGMKLLVRLIKIAGPGFGAAASLNEAVAVVVNGIGAVIGSLADRLDPDEIVSIAHVLAKTTRAEIDAGTGRMLPLAARFDVHFQGDYIELIEWMTFALRTEFGPLLTELGARAKPESDPDK